MRIVFSGLFQSLKGDHFQTVSIEYNILNIFTFKVVTVVKVGFFDLLNVDLQVVHALQISGHCGPIQIRVHQVTFIVVFRILVEPGFF